MSLSGALLLDPYPYHYWLARRTDGVGGTGTSSDPLNVPTPEKFDSLLNGFPSGSVIHLGPGTFQTRGYYDGGAFSGYGWQVKARMRIVGSGADVTTLQLVIGTNAGAQFYAVGHPLTTSAGGPANLADFVEICDLTIDCNKAGQGGDITQARCGAIRVMGNHVRIARVRAINWGTMLSNKPCYAIALVTADPESGVLGVNNSGIEDCIMTNPSTSGPAVAIHVGPKEDVDATREASGKVPFIRNCFIDYGTFDALYDHRAISIGWCLGGTVEGNQVYNVKYGGPYAEKFTTRDVVVRNNFFKNVATGPFWNLGQLSQSSVGNGSLTRSATVGTVTIANHGLSVGDRVKLTTTVTGFDGTYRVTSVNGNDFTITMAESGLGSAIVSSAYRVFGVDRLIVEGNVIELATGSNGTTGIHVHDNASSALPPDYVCGDVILRDNKIRYLDGTFDAGNAGYGMHVNGAKNLIVRDGVLECAPANPLRSQRCKAVTYYNNRNPAGVLIEGFNPDTLQRYAELETDNDFALIMSLFNRKAR